MNNNFSKQEGFTLVELLVALAIISTSMVAIFSLIIQNIQVQKINKDFLTASMLAQEGLELVRNIRDENWLEEQGTWNDILDLTDDTFTIDYTWSIDYAPDIISNSGARLKINSGFYEHTTGNDSDFYRLITVNPSNSDDDGDGVDDYIEVKSEVRWLVKGHPHYYIADTLLYDWR